MTSRPARRRPAWPPWPWAVPFAGRGRRTGGACRRERPGVRWRGLVTCGPGCCWWGGRRARGQPELPPEYRAVAARLLISLAHLEAEQGRTEHGLHLLAVAEEMTAPADRGVLLSQRGLLLMRTWRIAEALRLFDAAVPLLDGYPDVRVLARLLLNRGFLASERGERAAGAGGLRVVPADRGGRAA